MSETKKSRQTNRSNRSNTAVESVKVTDKGTTTNYSNGDSKFQPKGYTGYYYRDDTGSAYIGSAEDKPASWTMLDWDK